VKKKSFFFLSLASATATKPVDAVLVNDKYAPDAADDPRTSSNLSRVRNISFTPRFVPQPCILVAIASPPLPSAT
jgi:hypothetical protein